MYPSSPFIQRTLQWWRAKAGFLVAVLLVFLAANPVGWQQGLMLMGLALMAILGIGSLGHVINDWTDIAPDLKAGKSNMMAGRSITARFGMLLLCAVIGHLPWFLGLKANGIVAGLLLAETLLFAAYSVPPLRLKRFPCIAVLLDALYAYVIPSQFLLHSFALTISQTLDRTAIAATCLWTLALGLRHIFNHHVHDAANDRLASSPNLTWHYSPNRLLGLVRHVLVPLETFGMLLAVATLAGDDIGLPLALYVAFGLTAIICGSPRFPFLHVRFGTLVLDGLYLTGFGFIGLLFLVAHQWQYVLLLVLFILLLTDIPTHPLPGILARGLREQVLKAVKAPFQSLSLLFNWSLYYFRKWVLKWSEERNWGRHYAKRLQDLHLDARGTIAIFNANYDKYSETFVANQRRVLDHRIRYYHGSPKPLMEAGEGHLAGAETWMRDARYALLSFFDMNPDDQDDRLIANDLLRHDVSLIIAHFGQMGVQLLPVVQQTGIPMIVIFHGYDVWNRSELNADRYLELFSTAAAVIGVSRQICDRLRELGCPDDKLTYLPALVDAVFFEAYSKEVVANGPVRFLSVGRFARTKAPFLLLMAFGKVVEQLPDAQLTMVGTDDGEHLVEVCRMMVQAMGLERNVRFAGVLPPEKVRDEMLRSSIFVQHSVTTPLEGDREGTPVGIMEAMALGRPIVATRHAGMAEMLEHEASGLLVEEYDLEGMAAAMLRLARDPELRAALGRQAAATIRQNDVVTGNTEILSELIDRYKLKR